LKEIEDIRAGAWGQEVQGKETSEQPPEPSIQNEVRPQLFEEFEILYPTYDRSKALNKFQKKISMALA